MRVHWSMPPNLALVEHLTTRQSTTGVSPYSAGYPALTLVKAGFNALRAMTESVCDAHRSTYGPTAAATHPHPGPEPAPIDGVPRPIAAPRATGSRSREGGCLSKDVAAGAAGNMSRYPD